MLATAASQCLMRQYPNKVEDHHAVCDLQVFFDTDAKTAERILVDAMKMFPGVRHQILITEPSEKIMRAKFHEDLSEYRKHRYHVICRRIQTIAIFAAVVALCALMISRTSRGQEGDFDTPKSRAPVEVLNVSPPVEQPAVIPRQVSAPKGYYIFMPTIGAPDEGQPHYPEPGITGAVIRIGAKVIVSTNTPTQYNWKALDQRIRELKVHSPNSHWQLQIHTGVHYPPAWERAGAKTVSFLHKKYGRSKMLLPWDPKAIQLYAELMKAAGQRYGSDTTLDMVHVTFPQAYSPEMHMPVEVARLPGFEQKIKAAYLSSVPIVCAAFPNKAVCLNIFNVSKYSTGDHSIKLTRDIVNNLVATNPNLWCQVNSWNAKSSWANYEAYKLLLQVDCQRQLEQVQSSSRPEYGGTFKQSLHYLSDAEVGSAIIYYNDQDDALKNGMPIANKEYEEVEPKYGD
jgi:hypothetical protein